MKIDDIISFFDFENCDYFYHVTGKGIGELIFQEGLLVDGTNILETKNIKDTTTVEITPDMVSSIDDFIDFVDGEVNSHISRDTSEMIIIGTPKEYDKHIVSKYDKNKEGQYYRGIITPNHIMGYINEDLEFIPNEEYEFGNDEFIDSFYDSGKFY